MRPIFPTMYRTDKFQMDKISKKLRNLFQRKNNSFRKKNIFLKVVQNKKYLVSDGFSLKQKTTAETREFI